MDLRNHVSEVLSNQQLVQKTLIVGVSGGIDSMVLLHILNAIRTEKQFTLIVAHVNHSLRGVESDDDERFVASVCDSLGVQNFSTKVDVMGLQNERGLGLEAAARQLRYECFREIVNKTNAQGLMLAHNLDDVAETMIMNLSRGSGTKGLSAFPEVRALTGTSAVLVRPLRTVPRSDIVEYSNVFQVNHREDSSNSDVSFLRNAIRMQLLPVLKNVFSSSILASFLQSAELMSDANQILTEATKQAAAGVLGSSNAGVDIQIAPLQQHSSPMQRQLIRVALSSLIRNATENLYPPSHTDTYRVQALCNASVGSKATLKNSVVALRERESIRVTFAQELTEPFCVEFELGDTVTQGSRSLHSEVKSRDATEVDSNANHAYIDVTALHLPLRWRTWRNSDRFIPLGMDGSVLVSDLLTNAKISHSARKSVTVVEDEMGLVWVCGIRLAHRARVTSATTKIAVIRIDL